MVRDDLDILLHLGRDLFCTLTVWLALDLAVLFLVGRITVDFVDATTAVAAARRGAHPRLHEACAAADVACCEDVGAALLPGAYAGFEAADKPLHGALGFAHAHALGARAADLAHDAPDRAGEGVDLPVELVLGGAGRVAQLPRRRVAGAPVDVAERAGEGAVREAAVDGDVEQREGGGDVGVVRAGAELVKPVAHERLEDGGENSGGGEGERQGLGAVEKESEGEPSLERGLAWCDEREGLDQLSL